MQTTSDNEKTPERGAGGEPRLPHRKGAWPGYIPTSIAKNDTAGVKSNLNPYTKEQDSATNAVRKLSARLPAVKTPSINRQSMPSPGEQPRPKTNTVPTIDPLRPRRPLQDRPRLPFGRLYGGMRGPLGKTVSRLPPSLQMKMDPLCPLLPDRPSTVKEEDEEAEAEGSREGGEERTQGDTRVLSSSGGGGGVRIPPSPLDLEKDSPHPRNFRLPPSPLGFEASSEFSYAPAQSHPFSLSASASRSSAEAKGIAMLSDGLGSAVSKQCFAEILHDRRRGEAAEEENKVGGTQAPPAMGERDRDGASSSSKGASGEAGGTLSGGNCMHPPEFLETLLVRLSQVEKERFSMQTNIRNLTQRNLELLSELSSLRGLLADREKSMQTSCADTTEKERERRKGSAERGADGEGEEEKEMEDEGSPLVRVRRKELERLIRHNTRLKRRLSALESVVRDQIVLVHGSAVEAAEVEEEERRGGTEFLGSSVGEGGGQGEKKRGALDVGGLSGLLSLPGDLLPSLYRSSGSSTGDTNSSNHPSSPSTPSPSPSSLCLPPHARGRGVQMPEDSEASPDFLSLSLLRQRFPPESLSLFNERRKGGSMQSVQEVEYAVLKRCVEDLNRTLEEESESGAGWRIVKENGIARFSEAPSRLIVFYSDGMIIEGRPFRTYEAEKTQEALRDLLDGFFPAELQTEFPDGVFLVPMDVTREKFTPGTNDPTAIGTSGRGVPGSPRRNFLQRLPERVIRNGEVVAVRAAVARRYNLPLQKSKEREKEREKHTEGLDRQKDPSEPNAEANSSKAVDGSADGDHALIPSSQKQLCVSFLSEASPVAEEAERTVSSKAPPKTKTSDETETGPSASSSHSGEKNATDDPESYEGSQKKGEPSQEGVSADTPQRAGRRKEENSPAEKEKEGADKSCSADTSASPSSPQGVCRLLLRFEDGTSERLEMDRHAPVEALVREVFKKRSISSFQRDCRDPSCRGSVSAAVASSSSSLSRLARSSALSLARGEDGAPGSRGEGLFLRAGFPPRPIGMGSKGLERTLEEEGLFPDSVLHVTWQRGGLSLRGKLGSQEGGSSSSVFACGEGRGRKGIGALAGGGKWRSPHAVGGSSLTSVVGSAGGGAARLGQGRLKGTGGAPLKGAVGGGSTSEMGSEG
uniref:SEP domain-containing protein n=1 Tax=Chromera velia CCMP2878 TaxID=1169474 RepID=A0A0G4HS96_9ALVE|eukprot:Cvel_8261.t1-p1 / transcript=Cvel_8261.t1 / gene=Cvel_8261 / organism=Chromera_velia_CCMP2878 / gene_product=UBX domain-containing protein 11, putative / transcript_product=UBX domain-containing protein 11, putative / location=Cvel_scaffold452:43367-49120(+) / protein_length=1148 / sequence_SO=supercontig / SO=protein_coding / is_pseudo=false